MRVLIATDGEQAGDEALRCAAEMFGSDAQYTVLSVGVPVPYTSITPFGIVPAMMAIGDPDALGRPAEHARQVAEDGAAQLESEDLDVEWIAEVGGPGATICAVAAEEDIDVIVIGVHERGWLAKMLEGSTTSDVVDDAPCHVLVVRSDSNEG